MWLTLSISACISYGTLVVLQRVIAVESKNPRATSIIFNLWCIVFSFLLFLPKGFGEFRIPENPLAYIYLLIAALGYGLFERWRMRASQLVDASSGAVISNIGVVIAFIGSVVLAGESLRLEQVAGALLILFALLLVSYQKKNGASSISPRAVMGALGIYALMGLGWMFDQSGSRSFSPSFYMMLVWTVPFIFLVFPIISRKELLQVSRDAGWKLLVLASLNVIGYYLQALALEIEKASFVIPVVNFSTLVAVLSGMFFLHERGGIVRKLFGAVLAILGIMCIVR